MAHVRTQIRNKLEELFAGLATTEFRVFQRRAYPLSLYDLPGLCIYSGEEEILTGEMEGEIGVGTVQDRSYSVIVEAIASDSDDIDGVLDQISAEVETKLFTDPFLGNLVTDCTVAETNQIDSDKYIEKPVGGIEMRLQLRYFTKEGQPEIAINKV